MVSLKAGAAHEGARGVAHRGIAGALQLFAAEALMLPTGLLTAAFLTRSLGPADYGRYTLTAALVLWAEWSVAALFSRAAIKFAGEAPDSQPVGTAILRLHLLAGGAVFILACAAAQPLARLMGEPALAAYLALFALDIPLFCLAQAHQHLALGRGEFACRSASGAVRWIARFVLIVAFVGRGLGVTGAILGILGATILELLVLRTRVRPRLFGPAGSVAGELLRFARPLFAFALLLRLHDSLDVLMLQAFSRAAHEVGVYGAARNLSMVPAIAAMAVAPVLLATLSRLLHHGDEGEARTLTHTVMRAGWGLLPMVGLAAGAAHEIVALLFGDRFAATAPLLAPLLTGSAALVFVAVASAVLTAAGQAERAIRIAGPQVVMSLAAYILLIPMWGAMGAALSSCAGSLLGAGLACRAIYRLWRVHPPLATVVRSAAGAFLAYTATGLLLRSGLPLAVTLPAVTGGVLLIYGLTGEFVSPGPDTPAREDRVSFEEAH